MPEKVIAYVVRECLQGIEYLHSNKVIHRDIKGQNVLFTRDYGVKLVDFGVAAKLKDNRGRAKTVIGTPYWMAPEVIAMEDVPEGEDVAYDNRCDIWSLGITAIELAEGQPPLSKLQPMKALFQIPRNKPPTLGTSHKWSKAFHAIVERMLIKEYKDRPGAMMLLLDPFVTTFNENDAKKDLKECLAKTHPKVDESEKEWRVADPTPVAGPSIETLVADNSKKKAADLSKEEKNYGSSVRKTDNLAAMSSLTESAIVAALSKRHKDNVIYTFIGDILIACNPYKPLPIYSQNFVNLFAPNAVARCTIPHIFGIAEV